jgi:hypothetical protein
MMVQIVTNRETKAYRQALGKLELFLEKSGLLLPKMGERGYLFSKIAGW